MKDGRLSMGSSLLATILSAGAAAMAAQGAAIAQAAEQHRHTDEVRISNGGYHNRAHGWGGKRGKLKGRMRGQHPGGPRPSAARGRRDRA